MKPTILNNSLHILKRHPLLYYIRYILLSKNHSGIYKDDIGCFNDLNSIESIPKLFFEVNSKIKLNPEMDEFEKAIEISNFITDNITEGPALSLSSEKTLEKLLEGKGGVCSDVSLLFSIFCVINSIKVKEWNCVDQFYKTKYGHTFNEIYSTKLNKWITIDIGKKIYFTKSDQKIPLSTIELFTYLRESNELKYVLFANDIRNKLDRIPFIYSINTIPFITNNYDNNKIDHYLNKYQFKLPLFVINALMILHKKNYNFIFVMDNYKEKLLPRYFQLHKNQSA